MAVRLGEILVEESIITPKELEKAIEEQQRTREFLGKILIDRGLVTERKLLRVLGKQQGIQFLELTETLIDDKAIKFVPARFAWHYKIMPVSMEGDDLLTIAVSNPFDMWPIEDLETNLNCRVEKVLATSADIEEATGKYYGVAADTIEKILADEEPEKEESAAHAAPEKKIEDLEKTSDDASVVKLVNQILQQAIKIGATDVHIEHFRDDLVLRYRIDGILRDAQVSEKIKYLYPSIVSRIKVMSGLDIIERRLPQDGRAKVKIGKEEYDLRTSIMPTLYGEHVVIRILPTSIIFDMSNLGMSEKDLEALGRLLKRSNGIIFVTGPTGSGKTTTLYTCLNKLNTRATKIITIEDPIEYELPGISQVQVNSKIGLTFGRTLRSTLRHDPDIIMVGEVRDFETAEITIQTALTGHLVFSTLHTNDAASGATRLIDIGVEPYLIASSVSAFIAQRLVRIICENCRMKDTERAPQIIQQMKNDLNEMFPGKTPEIQIHKGKGCKACNSTGYRGRTGIYEILLVKDDIRDLIIQKASSNTIKKKAVDLGMRTLRQDGWEKVLAGITTPEEIIRVSQMEE